MRFRPVLLALAVLACTGAPSGSQSAPSPTRDRITVDVHAGPAAATQRVLATFTGDSLIVARSEPGNIVAEPVNLRSLGMNLFSYTYVANVAGTSDSTSCITLFAYESMAKGQDAAQDRNRKLLKSDARGKVKPFWARLERLAAADGS